MKKELIQYVSTAVTFLSYSYEKQMEMCAKTDKTNTLVQKEDWGDEWAGAWFSNFLVATSAIMG